jgi:hypothetical protein
MHGMHTRQQQRRLRSFREGLSIVEPNNRNNDEAEPLSTALL